MNVHQGGGLALLIPLLRALPAEQAAVLLIDARARLPQDLPGHIEVKRVAPSVPQRLAAERWLAAQVSAADRLLCFGNLPPLLRSRGRVAVFVQNRYLIDPVSLNGLGWRARCRLAVERLWLARCARHAQTFIVQTPSMQHLCEAAVPSSRGQLHVWPYAAARASLPRHPGREGRQAAAFIYPASGDAHKNHRRLVQAWCLLAQEGCRPSLTLTFDPAAYPELQAFVDEHRRRHDLAVTNLGVQPHEQLLAAYRSADALIYPSLLESFGLPLIEAAAAGLPVVAAELDYVRDILDPVQTFDPHSPVAIARAVKRFIGMPQAGLGLMDAAEFLSRLLASGATPPASETMPS